MLIITLIVLLIAGSKCDYIPECPKSNERSYHEYKRPGIDFYICQWGHDVEYITCEMEKYTPESKCESNDPCCTKYFSILNADKPPTPTPMFPRYNLTLFEFFTIVVDNYAFKVIEQRKKEDRFEPATQSPECLKSLSTPAPKFRDNRSLFQFFFDSVKEYVVGYRELEKSSSTLKAESVTPTPDYDTHSTTTKPMFTRYNLTLLEILQTITDNFVNRTNRNLEEREKAQRESEIRCPKIYPSPKPRVNHNNNLTFFGFLRDAANKYAAEKRLVEQSILKGETPMLTPDSKNTDSTKVFTKRSSQFDEMTSNKDKAASSIESKSSTGTEIHPDPYAAKVSTTESIKTENGSSSKEENSDINTNSTEKLELFTRKVIIPIIQEIVNDHSKMSKVAGLFRRYFRIFVPIAADLTEQLEEPSSVLRLSRDKILEAKKMLEEEPDVLLDALREILPPIFYKLGDNLELFMDMLDETAESYSVSLIQMFFKYLMFLIKFQLVTEDSNEFLTFESMFDIRRDIDIGSRIMKAITEDERFLEEINPTALILQLLFF